MTKTALPQGFRVGLVPSVVRCHGGDVLLDTHSGAMTRLRPPAFELLADTDQITVTDATSGALARALMHRGMADPLWVGAPHEDLGSLTVVIPVRDRAEAVARLLDALPTGLGGVIVVDDGSVDPQRLQAVSDRYAARVIRHMSSRGPAAARNTGAGAADTEFIGFLDSDVVPDPAALTTLLREMRDPLVAIAAPRILDLPVSRPSWLTRYEHSRSSLDLGTQGGRVAPATRLSYVPSAALVVRKSALAKGFDESMHVAEDVDLVWRLVADGWIVRYQPAAIVRHEHRAAFGPWVRRKAFYGTGAAPLARRHGDLVAPMRVPPLPAIAIIATATGTPVGSAVGFVTAASQLGVTAYRLKKDGNGIAAAPVLTAMSLVSTAAQGAAMLNRHHWPVALAFATRSRRFRAIWAVAAVVEGVADHRRVHADLDLPRYLLAHRLDDLAYGAGVWWGAIRARSIRPLLPALPVRRKRAAT